MDTVPGTATSSREVAPRIIRACSESGFRLSITTTGPTDIGWQFWQHTNDESFRMWKNMTMTGKATVIIPARMASSRYPGKPLAMILGLPMIEHVRRRALLAKGIDEVVVATCDQAVVDVVTAAGGKAILTGNSHERCTTRVEEAMRDLDGEIVVIVQGDEPLILPEAIEQVVTPLRDRLDVSCTNLLSKIADEADFQDINIVKAATNQAGFIMYFSRAPIPCFRHKADCPIFRQMGIMAFRTAFLTEYAALPETPFEKAESIDMLRLLEHGYRILGAPTEHATIGVDHVGDIDRVEQILRTDAMQRALHRQVEKGKV